MKILQVSHSFYPCYQAGGVVKVAYDISKELVKKDHAVTVYTTDGCKHRLDVQTDVPVNVDGIHVYYFKNLSNWLRIKLKIATPFALVGVIRKEIRDFDIIHIHEHRTVLAIVITYYARKYNVPYIVQPHGSALMFFQRKSEKKLFDKLWGNRILLNASKLIALTETEAEQYQKMGVLEKNIAIVPNGINIEDYQTLPKKGNFKQKYGIESDEKIILYVGRISGTKGIDLLIESCSMIFKEYPKVKLVIVGPDDGYLSTMSAQIQKLNLQEKINVIGYISSEEKIQAFVDSDVFVTPSFSGFPLTFIEACACGLPIITTTHGDALEWIDNNVGFVSNYDLMSLKNAIIKILEDDSLRINFGSNGIDAVNREFNWTAIVLSLEKIYLDITDAE